MAKDKYFEGDGLAFGAPGHFYKWIVPFRGFSNAFDFEEVTKEEYLDHKAFVLSLRLEQNISRFPLPICFDPAEEIMELSRRSRRIRELARRYTKIKFLKKANETGRRNNDRD